MVRGRIPEEKLDDRTWQELVDQALSLVPHYAPEWTDRGPGDLGVTLVELFAWLVEGLTYRLNRVPERTYAAMLNLLGVTRDPARPASVRLVLTAQPGVDPAPVVRRGSRYGTLPTEAGLGVVFETDADLTLVPANLRWAFLGPPASPRDLSAELVRGPLGGARMALPVGARAELYLALDARPAADLALHVGLAGAPVVTPADARLEIAAKWAHTVAGASPWKDIPAPSADGTSGLRRSGEVRLPPLAGWEARPGADVLQLPESAPARKTPSWWLRWTLEAKERDPTHPSPAGAALTVALDHVLLNSVSATHVRTVADEELTNATGSPPGSPESTGAPWQRFELKSRPVYRAPRTRLPYAHVTVTVHERRRDGTFEPRVWRMVDELPAGPERCYRLDPVTGTVLFGNHDGSAGSAGAGLIPPEGSRVRASYRAVEGGIAGNVPAGSVRLFYEAPAGVMEVTNPGPGRDGADEEPIEETKRRAPETLRIRNRAVTAEDYEYLAREASTLVARARALPTRPDWEKWEEATLMLRHPGTVNVLIVPDLPEAEVPVPPDDLVDEVALYLTARRAVGTAVYVRAPVFRMIRVTAKALLFRSQADDPAFFTNLEDALTRAVVRFLHPLRGGPDGAGWEIGQDLLVSGLFARLQPLVGSEGILQTLQVEIAAATARTAREGTLVRGDLAAAVGVRMLEYELVCSAPAHEIRVTEVG